MNRRQLLTKSVASLFLVLLITFAWVIFKGTVLTSNVPKQSGPSTHALFKGLQAGQTELRRYQGGIVWVTALDDSIRAQLLSLDTHLLNPKAGCENKNDYCVLSAATSIDGIHVQFTRQEPSQLSSSIPWVGGFVDPTSGELYDLLGRAYVVNKKQKVLSLPVVDVNNAK